MQLACGHSFCQPCVSKLKGNWGGRSQCPTCRVSLGVSEPRPNYALLRCANAMGAAAGKKKDASAYQIYVKNLAGKSIRLDVQASDTISDLKRLIHSYEGISPDAQRLIHAGKELDTLGNRTLVECGIHAESSVHICMRLRGGSSAFCSRSVFYFHDCVTLWL